MLKFGFITKTTANLKHRCYVTIQVNLGEIDNMIMQSWLPKQGKVGHPETLLFKDDL